MHGLANPKSPQSYLIYTASGHLASVLNSLSPQLRHVEEKKIAFAQTIAEFETAV